MTLISYFLICLITKSSHCMTESSYMETLSAHKLIMIQFNINNSFHIHGPVKYQDKGRNCHEVPGCGGLSIRIEMCSDIAQSVFGEFYFIKQRTVLCSVWSNLNPDLPEWSPTINLIGSSLAILSF